jgi:predicted metal-dependent phosphoesterase TrpH
MSDLPPPDAAANAGERSLTRYHLAQALVERGHCGSIREAFQVHLGDAAGKVPCSFPSFEEAIARARACGGLTSWAHPNRDTVDRFAGRLAAAGLSAFEGLRPGLTSKERGYFRKVARRYGMVLTGGSDWHGWTDGPLGLWALERRDLDPFFQALYAA